jgi:hypothetical protein
MEKNEVKLLTEMFKDQQEIKNFVKNGIIDVFPNGSISFKRYDYVLKNDQRMFHHKYGFSAEKDHRLEKDNMPRSITVPAGKEVVFCYAGYTTREGLRVSVELSFGDYKECYSKTFENIEEIYEEYKKFDFGTKFEKMLNDGKRYWIKGGK